MKNNEIKIIVMDIDGTLTDGAIHIGQHGELFKSFYCRDGLAIVKALKNGIQPVILTSRVSEIVKNRAEELGIVFVLQGAGDNKKGVLQEFMQEHGFKKINTAYIGDDINDLESMKLCECIGCPADAVKQVKEIANYICTHDGGKGAVREFIDWILENRSNELIFC